ncbi:hypothetical protein Tco_0939529 [Tanacetum coccineum]|uniref:Uncharacterized protein n=1 Tax=Tanacetum coccineum TaxID=301880 RepID=A0ABQ5DL25_9ASTR
MRELRRKLFAGTDDEDAHEHVHRVLEIVDLFHFPGITHDAVMFRAADDEWIRKSIKNTESITYKGIKLDKRLQENAYQLTQTVLTNTGEKRTTMGKGNIKDPVPRDSKPTPFLGHLKEQMGIPCKTRETVCMIENVREVYKMRAQEDEGDMDVG